MTEKFIDAIVLSSTLFGSIYLFNNSLQRITDLNRNIDTFPFYLDCFIIGITSSIMFTYTTKAIHMLK